MQSAVVSEIRRYFMGVRASCQLQPAPPEFGTLFNYSDAQRWVFFDSRPRGRFRIINKGRRAGMTRGAAHAAIEWANAGLAVLWGDTIQTNLKAYYELFFKPALRAKGLQYRWNGQDKVLQVGSGYIHMRSAQNPNNWEGFGYHRVILNEAGIILENRALFEKTVRPMLMDYTDSELIALGKPKGRNLFYDLFLKGLAGEEGYYTPASHLPPQPGQTHFAYTALDNPWLNRDNSLAEIASLAPGVREQEGLGQFVDSEQAFRVVPRAWVTAAMERGQHTPRPLGAPTSLGVDPSRGGDDETVLAPRWGLWFGHLEAHDGQTIPNGQAVAALVLTRGAARDWELAATTAVNVDIVGVGTSPYDFIREFHRNTHGFNGGLSMTHDALTDRGLRGRLTGKSHDPLAAQLKFYNLRAAAYWNLREMLDPANALEVCLPNDLELADDLCEPGFEITSRGILVEAKDNVKKRLGRSPGRADALVMAAWDVISSSYQKDYD